MKLAFGSYDAREKMKSNARSELACSITLHREIVGETVNGHRKHG